MGPSTAADLRILSAVEGAIRESTSLNPVSVYPVKNPQTNTGILESINELNPEVHC